MAQFWHFVAWVPYVALYICFAIILWQFLDNRLWKWALFCFIGIIIPGFHGPGFLFALILGWQEASKIKIRSVLRLYTVLVTYCFFASTVHFYDTTVHPPVVEDPKAKGKNKPRPKPQVGVPIAPR